MLQEALQGFLLFEDGMIVYQLVGSVTIRDTIEMDFFYSKSRDWNEEFINIETKQWILSTYF